MKKAIIHIGPPKCGSSSIQKFFQGDADPCIEKVAYRFLVPRSILGLDEQYVSKSAIDDFENAILHNIVENEVLLISHEGLFHRPVMVGNICRILSRKVDDIVIIGYYRKQSDYIISTYNQWLFRTRARIEEVEVVLASYGIDSIHFSGLEKVMIAGIIDDFHSARFPGGKNILNWFESYNALANHTAKYGASIKCSPLPKVDSSRGLLTDFCDKAGLSIKDEFIESSQLVENVSFNRGLIEGGHLASLRGMDFPNEHEGNNMLIAISKGMHSNWQIDQEFEFVLRNYVDAFFSESNSEFCKQFRLSTDYFQNHQYIPKANILDVIREKQFERTRSNSLLLRYKELCANLTEVACYLSRDINKKAVSIPLNDSQGYQTFWKKFKGYFK